MADNLSLVVEIDSCRGLIAADVATSDPLVKVVLGKKDIHQTKHVLKTLDPVFTAKHDNACLLECSRAELSDAGGILFVVKDWNMISKNVDIGSLLVPVDKILLSTGEFVEMRLNSPKDRPSEEAGYITFKIREANRADVEALSKSSTFGIRSRSSSGNDDDSTDSRGRGRSPRSRKSPVQVAAGKKVPGFDGDDMTSSTSLMDDDGATVMTASTSTSWGTSRSDATPVASGKSGNNPKPNTKLNISITVKSCRDLPGDANSVNPFVVVKLGRKEIHKTKPVLKSLSPQFPKDKDNLCKLDCTVQDLAFAGGITFIVKKYDPEAADPASGEEISKVRIPPKGFYNPSGELREYKLKVPAAKGSSMKLDGGFIRLKLKKTTPKEKAADKDKGQATKRAGKTPSPPRHQSPVPRTRTPSPPRGARFVINDADNSKESDDPLAKFTKKKKKNDHAIDPLDPLDFSTVSSIRTYKNKDEVTKQKEKQKDQKHLNPQGFYTRAKITGNDLAETLSLFKSAREQAPDFQIVEIHGLQAAETREDFMLAEEVSKQANLRKVHLVDFDINCHPSVNPPLLETLGELPALEELEIRMKERKELPKSFLSYVCQYSQSIKSLILANVILDDSQLNLICQPSSPLESLVLWNIELEFKQLKLICEDLMHNKTIQRFELWCSNLGDNFGALLAEMLEANKSLETVVVSHVGMYGSSCVALMDALKCKNNSLKSLTLLSVAENDKDTVSRSVIQMMNENKSLESLSVTYEKLGEDKCVQVSKDIKRCMAMRKLAKGSSDNSHNSNGCIIV